MNSSSFNGVSAVVVGAYLAAVFVNGNSQALVKQLAGDTGYLEFLVACFIVKWIIDNDVTGVAWPLLVIAILAAGMKLVGRLNVMDAIDAFSSGKAGLFETVKTLFASNAEATP